MYFLNKLKHKIWILFLFFKIQPPFGIFDSFPSTPPPRDDKEEALFPMSTVGAEPTGSPLLRLPLRQCEGCLVPQCQHVNNLGLGLCGRASLIWWHRFLLVSLWMLRLALVSKVYRCGDGSFPLHLGPRVRHVGVAFDADVRPIRYHGGLTLWYAALLSVMVRHRPVLEKQDGQPRDFGAISLFCMDVSSTDLVNRFESFSAGKMIL